jgi:uncharacterized membrane protein
MSDQSQGPGWWQASDGKWYPPEQAPGAAQLDLGEALSYGWSKFVENLSTMIVIVIIFFGVQLVFSLVAQSISPASVFGALFVSGLVIAIGLFLGFLVEAGIIRAALAIVRGQKPEASMMFSTQRLASFAIGAIIVAALSFVGFLACCIGYLLVRLFLLFWGFFVLDPDAPKEPVDAIKGSFDLVSKNMGDVLVFAIVIVLINIVTCGLAIGFTEISIGYAYRKLNGQSIAA